jgi:hypothetical protein
VTIRNARHYHIRRRRVPSAEGYFLISANLRVVYTNENEELGVEMVPARGGVEVTGIAALPAPEVGRVLSHTALEPRTQMRSSETISTARHNGRPDGSIKRLWIFVYTRIWPYGQSLN